MKRWAELANDYFSAGLDDASAQRWEDEIKMQVQGATPAQACEAIRLNMTTKLRRKLTVGDVIGWIREQLPTKGRKLVSCRLCNRGWVDLADELPAKGFTLDEYSVACKSSLPCICKSGGHLMQTVYADAGSSLERLRRKAIEQVQYAEGLYKEMNIHDFDGLKTAMAGIGNE